MGAELPAGIPGITQLTIVRLGQCPSTPFAILALTRSLLALLEASFLGVQQVVDFAYENQQIMRVLLFRSLLAQPQ